MCQGTGDEQSWFSGGWTGCQGEGAGAMWVLITDVPPKQPTTNQYQPTKKNTSFLLSSLQKGTIRKVLEKLLETCSTKTKHDVTRP